MTPLCLILSLFAHPLVQESENLIRNGSVDGPRDWSHTPGASQVEFGIDRKLGASDKGSLRIENGDEADRGAHNWRQVVDLSEVDAARLRLAGQVRLDGAGDGTEACLILNVLDAQGNALHHSRCPEVRKDADWHQSEVVFELPPGADHALVMAYLVGGGSAWFDDLVLEETERPVTEVARPSARTNSDPKHAELARLCAADLPWHFESRSAYAEARETGRPILVYVRCTDDKDNLESARTTIPAEAIRLQEDGYAKDLLFRAGPLSDRHVRALIQRRFVPACSTYLLSAHPQGIAGSPPAWGNTGGSRFSVSTTEGNAAPGSLHIECDDPDSKTPHNWFQAIELDLDLELPTSLELEASMKTSGFQSGSEATVMVQCWKGEETVGFGRVNEVRKDTDWETRSSKFQVPAGTTRIRLLCYLVGAGEVWFDDVAVRTTKPKDAIRDLLVNGSIDRMATGDLDGYPIHAGSTTTPALFVIDADGAVVRKLHRIGTLSSELIDRWLRDALVDLNLTSESEDPRELFEAGELDACLRELEGREDEAAERLRAEVRLRRSELAAALDVASTMRDESGAMLRGRIALRSGDWDRALSEFEAAEEDEDLRPNARFWQAWAHHRSGERERARALWEELAEDTPLGRRAAACLLEGPRLPLAVSVRSWPSSEDFRTKTEIERPFGHDPNQSLTALLELQRPNGSFGEHMGSDGFGWSDSAITALVIDALRVREKKAAKHLKGPMRRAREEALEFLATWAARPHGPADAFNSPYVLQTLVAEKKSAAAGRVIEKIVGSQLEDGNWTVYHAERPASFNTALNVMALLAAKKARLDVPKNVVKRGLDALEAMRQESGRFPYSTAPGHEWMTSEHGSIARDALCEHALLVGGRGSKKTLGAALARYRVFASELRLPTKRLYDYFNGRGHGGYYFFFAHKNATDAARWIKGRERKETLSVAREAVLSAREGDHTFMDKFLLGRAYGTAMALLILAD